MNVQFAIKKENDVANVYVIEVNPRASRTVPFVSKATGVPVAKIAAKIMAGQVLDQPVTLAGLGHDTDPIPCDVSVKESVFPFVKFTGVDIVLSPEMKSTGEVMGSSPRFSLAFAKSQLAAGVDLPREGKIFVSVTERHKDAIVPLAGRLRDLGFSLIATEGTARRLSEEGIEVALVEKLQEGHPNLLDYLANKDVQLIMNTPSGKGARTDEGRIRAACVANNVSCITTIQAADAVVLAMEALQADELSVQPLQDRFPQSGRTGAGRPEAASGV